MDIRKASVNRICVVFYTLIVIFSCTILGHIKSKSFDVLYLTIAVLMASPLCIVNAGVKKGARESNAFINALLVLYALIYFFAVLRGNNSLESYLPLFALIACAYIGGKSSFDMQMARRWIETIALTATVLLLIQVIIHWILGVHIQMLPLSVLYGDQMQYATVIRTGYDLGSTIYRPSAFFLEPSHYVQFVVIALVSALLSAEKNKRISTAIFFTIGICATISSTGLVLLIVVWGLYALNDTKGNRMPKWIKTIIIIGLMLAFATILFYSYGALGVYLRRILPSNLFNLINEQEGRFWANRYLNSFSRNEWMIGRGVGTAPSGYYMGYVRIIYQIGIVGFLAYLAVIICAIVQTKPFSRYIGLLYIILLFGAEYDVFRYVIAYLTLVFAGIREVEPMTTMNELKNIKLKGKYSYEQNWHYHLS